MQSTESAVCSIIAAFTSGLDICKKLHQRRKKDGNNKRPSRGQQTPAYKQKDKLAVKREEQDRLNRSLRKGSADVYNVYARHARRDGTRFATGDCMWDHDLATFHA